jgi:hypothetical protein
MVGSGVGGRRRGQALCGAVGLACVAKCGHVCLARVRVLLWIGFLIYDN